jgi:alkylation response protein AidB-like acyl-CoA dehydrogenase
VAKERLMDFSLSMEQELLRRSVREFAETVVADRVAWMEENDETPMDVVAEMAKRGLMGVCVPKAYGGTELGSLARMIVLEEIGRVSAACGFFLENFHLGIAPIVDFGTEEQKQKYLPGLAAGELLAALALTESTGGSDPAALQTSAVKDGDDYVLNGRKVFITNAHLADVVVVAARTGEGPRGISTFLVEKGTEGFKAGREERKFGIHGCNTGELVLDNCRVPGENLLGDEGRGLRIAFKAIGEIGRTGMAGTALGVLRACLEATVRHANERELYGKPIAKLQGIQWSISDIYLDWQMARLLCYQAAWMIDQGQRCDGETAAAKFQATEAAVRSAKKAIDIYGGYGYMMESPVQRYFRDAECLIASAGTSEVMRIVMARAALA